MQAIKNCVFIIEVLKNVDSESSASWLPYFLQKCSGPPGSSKGGLLDGGFGFVFGGQRFLVMFGQTRNLCMTAICPAGQLSSIHPTLQPRHRCNKLVAYCYFLACGSNKAVFPCCGSQSIPCGACACLCVPKRIVRCYSMRVRVSKNSVGDYSATTSAKEAESKKTRTTVG